MKITIKITKEVLRASMFCQTKGTSESTMIGQNCAIGKAVADLFSYKTWVGPSAIYYYKHGVDLNGIGDYSIRLPHEACVFIKEFDGTTPEDRINIRELSFEIDVPNEVIDDIGIGQVYKILSESKNLELA